MANRPRPARPRKIKRRPEEASSTTSSIFFGESRNPLPMSPESLLELLTAIQQGATTPREGLARLAHMPYEDLEFAKIDHHRALRTGLPEMIYAAGKTEEQLVEIFDRMAKGGENILATRVSPAAAAAVRARLPAVTYHAVARVLSLRPQERPLRPGTLAIVCAGTSDLPVAEEAAVTAELLANKVARFYDVGVAGVPPLLPPPAELAPGSPPVFFAGVGGGPPPAAAGLVR